MIEAVRGIRDILPGETERWEYLEGKARRLFGLYGYREVRPPLLEKTELFARAVGEATDIVEKEMYSFIDRNGDSLSLRPEGTASVVRGFIEHGLDRQLPWKVFYLGPMFRHERPQKGRYRQFHQIGCELFGPAGPAADAEMLAMLMRFFREIGLEAKVALEINSLGCPDCRPAYRQVLADWLLSRQDGLCDHCRGRIQRNPMRVLDCKGVTCKEVVSSAPRLVDHWCPACVAHFHDLTVLLHAMGVQYTNNPMLVRGLDYYTRTGFEVTTTALGSQNAVAAGGRYDQLVATMGGRPTPAVGFAMGLERLALLLDPDLVPIKVPLLFVAAMGQMAVQMGAQLAEACRTADLQVEADFTGGSLKTLMKRADRSKATYTAILGEQEVTDGTVLIKRMADGEQTRLSLLPWGDVVSWLQMRQSFSNPASK